MLVAGVEAVVWVEADAESIGREKEETGMRLDSLADWNGQSGSFWKLTDRLAASPGPKLETTDFGLALPEEGV